MSVADLQSLCFFVVVFFQSLCWLSLIVVTPGIILCMCPANERWRYIVMWSLIGCWAHIQNNPCHITDILLCLYIVSYTSKHQTSRWLLMAWCLFGVTETKMSSFWRNFRHWLHWTLSKWQRSVQPVTKMSSKWQHFRFSGQDICNHRDALHFSILNWIYLDHSFILSFFWQQYIKL